MSKKFTLFEEKIHDALESYELPYEAGNWNQLESKMNKGGAGSHWVVALAAAAFFTGIAGFAVYKYSFKNFEALSGSKISRFENLITLHSAPSDQEISAETGNSAISSINEPLTSPAHTSLHPASAEIVESPAGTAENSNTQEAAPNEKKATPATKTLSVKTNITESCSGGEVEFSAVNGPTEGSYLWNFGDGNFSNKPNPKHRYMKPGVYDVSLSITSKKDGQISTTVMNDLISIHPSPSADFEWDFINGPEDEPTIKIVNTSENASEFNWKFNDGSTSNVISPVRSYSEKGKQAISLEVSNEWGCSDSKVKYVVINQEYNLMAPAQFNPRTEVFMPEALKQGKLQFKLTVYNGEKPIYETNNKSKGWDGKIPGGEMAAAGQEYPWIVIIYNGMTKEEKYFSGTVKILP